MSDNSTLLPYEQGGFTFTLLSGSATIVPGSSDRNLVINQPSPTARVRIEADDPFDLLSFELEGMALNWEFSASSGAVYSLPHGTSSGFKNFQILSGWQNLSYVDILHDDNEPNAFIRVDSMRFNLPTTSPEPSSLVLLGMAIASMAGVSRFRSCRKRRPDKSACDSL